MLLIRIITDDNSVDVGGTHAETAGGHGHGSRPQWMRVLAMEIMRG